jgi:hypothetical protein
MGVSGQGFLIPDVLTDFCEVHAYRAYTYTVKLLIRAAGLELRPDLQ